MATRIHDNETFWVFHIQLGVLLTPETKIRNRLDELLKPVSGAGEVDLNLTEQEAFALSYFKNVMLDKLLIAEPYVAGDSPVADAASSAANHLDLMKRVFFALNRLQVFTYPASFTIRDPRDIVDSRNEKVAYSVPARSGAGDQNIDGWSQGSSFSPIDDWSQGSSYSPSLRSGMQLDNDGELDIEDTASVHNQYNNNDLGWGDDNVEWVKDGWNWSDFSVYTPDGASVTLTPNEDSGAEDGDYFGAPDSGVPEGNATLQPAFTNPIENDLVDFLRDRGTPPDRIRATLDSMAAANQIQASAPPADSTMRRSHSTFAPFMAENGQNHPDCVPAPMAHEVWGPPVTYRGHRRNNRDHTSFFRIHQNHQAMYPVPPEPFDRQPHSTCPAPPEPFDRQPHSTSPAPPEQLDRQPHSMSPAPPEQLDRRPRGYDTGGRAEHMDSHDVNRSDARSDNYGDGRHGRGYEDDGHFAGSSRDHVEASQR
ncbi:hypothetical protein P8C59_000343 [Phyllachora maydis]|uniref:Uncharacterized protein n=1 Tax=Phyllachora maydis TaxID=1825666 RepID=A0AAD9HXG2_9PEZI|nr:hypothetical protein P8C59_000343 [Phyllachora maydis]